MQRENVSAFIVQIAHISLFFGLFSMDLKGFYENNILFLHFFYISFTLSIMKTTM